MGLSLTAQAAPPPPDTITLTAVVRDFVERDESGGHPDFERNKEEEADGLMYNVVAPAIGDDGKPVWKSRGILVDRHNKFKYMQWEDSSGRPIQGFPVQPGRSHDVPRIVDESSTFAFSPAS